MAVSVGAQQVRPRIIAAVHRDVAPRDVTSVWGPALDLVWEFLRARPGLWSGGHNVFLYHHADVPGALVRCEFGVGVTRTFEPEGEVHSSETPGGEAVVAVHRGPYGRLDEAYRAIDGWMAANRREPAGRSWEVYGDPTPDPAQTETMVVRLLR